MNVQAPDGSVVQFPDGTDPNIVNQVMSQNFGPKQGPSPAPSIPDPMAGMGTGDKLAAGTGQGIVSANTGIMQMLAHNPVIAGMLGQGQMAMPEVREAMDQGAKKEAKIDAPLLATTPGQIGSIAGNTLVTSMVPSVGFGGKIVQAATRAAMQGADAGAIQPVAGDNYGAEKGAQIGMGAGTGAAVGGGISALGSLAKNIMPKNAVAGLFNAAGRGAADTPFAKEGEDLVGKTGVQLTPGEITGNKAQIALENNSRQSIASKNIAFAADQNKTQQLYDHVSNLIDNIGPSGGDPAAVGQRVQGAVKNAVNTLSDQRAAQAAQDYGVVNSMVQGKQAVLPTNYLQTLKSISDDLAGAPKNSDAAKLASSVADLQEEGVKNAYIPSLLKTRQYLSSVAGGQQRMASEASQPQQQRIAAQLLGAIDTDLDQSADKLGGDVGAALKNANNNYRQASQQIEGVKNMALGKLVGDDFSTAAGDGSFNKIPGETVMQRIQAMKPSEVDASVRLLQDHDPETLQAVKRSVLETALDRSQQMAPSEGANVLAMHPNVFVSSLAKTPEDQARLSALFSPKEQAQINDALNVARRMSDKTGTNFSGTTQAAELTSLGSFGTAALLGHPLPLLGLGGKMLGNRAIAQAMVNPEGRAIIAQLGRLPPGSAQAGQLAAQLAAIAGAQSVSQPANAGQ